MATCRCTHSGVTGQARSRRWRQSGAERGYQYIAITDHTKGLSIAGGINETEVAEQGLEVAKVNATSATTVLHSVELNLNPSGEGDMDRPCLAGLDLVLGSFHSALRRKDDQTERYLAALRNPTSRSWVTPAAAFTTSASASPLIGRGCSAKRRSSIRRSR